MTLEIEKENRIFWLGTLRGIAALLVFISHLPLELPFNILFVLGRIGVVIFFLITGYLAVKSRENKNCRQYLFNRFMRMYPIYWVLLIITFFQKSSEFSIPQLICNFTLFNEFVGYDCIIGASWMMPMQVCFFIFIALFNTKIITETKFKIKSITFNMPQICITALGVLSVITGVLRYKTGLPLPTAFFLLISMSFLGIYLNLYFKKQLSKKDFLTLTIIYFIFLIPSVILSYRETWISYIIAYAVGFATVYVFGNKNYNITMFESLGKIGFTFFLGADIIYSYIYIYMKHFYDIEQSIPLTILCCLIKFLSAILFAFIVTKFIEKPLLKWSKKIEKQFE